jgi:TIR domain/KTSC domain
MDELSSKKILKVFLCHASEDKPKVRELYGRLRQDGVNPWFDEKDLVAGQDWDIEIRKTVKKCDVILVCLTEASVCKTGYGQKEIRFALDAADEKPDGTIYIIPVLLEKCGVPFRLEKWQWVKYFEEDGYSKLLRSLRVRAREINVDVIPGDGNIERARKPIEESSGRLLYKSVVVRELLKQYKDGILFEDDIDILPTETVVGITQEALLEILEPFNVEPRKSEEKDKLLRLIGIQHPYQEWEEKNNKVQCFRNEVIIEDEDNDYIFHISVSSSNIKSIGYDSKKRILEIIFHNRSIYRYYDIPEHLYDGLMSASSQGKFLHSYIKSGGFAYEKIS